MNRTQKMHAVIMAGGEGKRLRPLTCNMPKPLAPLCGRPVLEYILELLAAHNFESATLTLLYQGEKIVRHFKDGQYEGIELNYTFEDKPLGTAGSVKQAALGQKGDFLVISGDAMCDFDLTKAVEFHRAKGSMATLIVKQADDPREYGLVNMAEDGKITGFLEKPSPAHCVTNFANTGIYILSPKVLDLIEDGRSVDFSGEVFPKMLSLGLPLYSYEEHGYWCDIGSFKTYVSCQTDMLSGKLKCNIKASNYNGVYINGHFPKGNFTVSAPSYIGSNVYIGENVHITNSVVCDNVSIGSNVKIKDSIILDGAYLADYSGAVNAVICRDAKLLKNSSVFECGVIGQSAVLGQEAVVPDGIKVWNGKAVPNGVSLTENLQYGFAGEIVCDEEGICGESNINITPAVCAKIGAAFAALKPDGVLGVGCAAGNASEAFRQAVISGILSAGCNAWDFGNCFETQFCFSMNKASADYGIYINASERTVVKIFAQGAMPLPRAAERRLEAAINFNEYRKASYNQFGEAMRMGALNKMYETELLENIKQGLAGTTVNIRTNEPDVLEVITNVLSAAGCKMSPGGLTLHISRGGRSLSIYSKKTGYVFKDRILSLACLIEFMSGSDVAIPFNAPQIIDVLAEEYKKKAFRYYECSCDNSDSEARRLAMRQPFVRDGLVMAVRILSFLTEKKISLAEALKMVPDFSTASRFVKLKENPAVVLKRLSADGGTIGEGIRLSHNGGDVLIRPVKSGRGMMLFAESYKAETAGELCDFFEDMIKKQ